jgi:serine protease Do
MKSKEKRLRKIAIITLSLGCLIAGFTAATLLNPVSMPKAQTSPLMPSGPESFSLLVKAAKPAVVNISTVKVIKRSEMGQGPPLFGSPLGPGDPFKDFFDRFFRDQVPKEYRQKSLGSGFIIDKDGFILTNNHVVEKANEIKVKLADDREFDARIIGHDPKTDLALIKIEADRPLKPLPIGDSEKLEVGDWVVAIGNPFGLGNTVTSGIVSAKYRQIGTGSYNNFIQTDAAINPGNSGGPLLNTAGEVIGINSAIFSQSGGNIGIGFAIPVNMAKDLLPQLKKGKVIRGWLGVMIQKITPELKDKLKLKSEKGALVADVTVGGPADKAGVKRGDVIVSFDGKAVKESNQLPFMVGSTPVGKEVTVEVIRKGRKVSLQVKIGKLQEQKEFMSVGKPKSRLGMTVEQINPNLVTNFNLTKKSGLVVVQVENNSPAADAGFQPGDIILEVDQVSVKDLGQFNQKINTYKKGDTILFLVTRRGGGTLYLTLKIGQ